MTTKFYGIRKTAWFIGVDVRSIQNWVDEEGGPPYYETQRGRGRMLFRFEELTEWIRMRSKNPLPPDIARQVPPGGEPLILIDEAAKLVGVNKQTLRRWGKLPDGPPVFYTPNGTRMYRKSQLIAWMRLRGKSPNTRWFGRPKEKKEEPEDDV